MSLISQVGTQNESLASDELGNYGVRDAILFLIDTTPQMFNEDPEMRLSYFRQCIQHYIQILQQKLLWNRKDWMGLVLFGTEKWDTGLEIKNVLTLQKLSLISIDMLTEAMKIDKAKWEYYKNISSSNSYPLYDVLWYATHIFSSVKVFTQMRRVILFTCHDNPPMTNDAEKHRIRVKSASYKDIGVELFVMGLGESWNHDIFYNDLELVSRKISRDDYKRISFSDLVEQARFPSKNMAKVSWRLGNGITLEVNMHNLCVKVQYLKTIRLSKDTNTPLIANTYMHRAQSHRNEEIAEEDEYESDDERAHSPILFTEISKTQTFGGKTIYFTPNEVRTLCNVRSPGIDLICVKNIHYDPIYHRKTPYFVTLNQSSCKGNKLVFGNLLHKCESKKLMMICAVTIRKHSPSNLYSMIPVADSGGFFLYKIPFAENVRDLRQKLSQYIYDRHQCPGSQQGVEILTNIIKERRGSYDPKQFPNPKLQVQRQNVETLALSLESREPPLDATLPSIDVMTDKIVDLVSQYKSVFSRRQEYDDDTTTAKRFKRSNGSARKATAVIDSRMMYELIKKRTVESCTVAQLRSYLNSTGLKTGGLKTKTDLVNRIYDSHPDIS